MPRTEDAYSSCCGAPVDLEEYSLPGLLKLKRHYVCQHCGNGLCRPVVDERPLIRGDVVNWHHPKLPPINQPVLACFRQHDADGKTCWYARLKDGTTVGCALLKLEKPNENNRREG